MRKLLSQRYKLLHFLAVLNNPSGTKHLAVFQTMNPSSIGGRPEPLW